MSFFERLASAERSAEADGHAVRPRLPYRFEPADAPAVTGGPLPDDETAGVRPSIGRSPGRIGDGDDHRGRSDLRPDPEVAARRPATSDPVGTRAGPRRPDPGIRSNEIGSPTAARAVGREPGPDVAEPDPMAPPEPEPGHPARRAHGRTGPIVPEPPARSARRPAPVRARPDLGDGAAVPTRDASTRHPVPDRDRSLHAPEPLITDDSGSRSAASGELRQSGRRDHDAEPHAPAGRRHGILVPPTSLVPTAAHDGPHTTESVATEVTVRIGRVDVIAEAGRKATASPARRARPRRVVSLDQYLAGQDRAR